MDLVLSVSLLMAAQGITKLLVCMYCSPSMPNPKSHPETPRFSTWLVRGGSLVSGGNLPRWVRSPEVSLWWKKMEMQKIGGAFFWKHQFEGVLCVFGVEKAETKRKRVGKKRFGNEIAGFRNKFTKPIRWNPHTVDGPETLQTGPGTSKNFENQYFPLMVATFPLRFLSSKRLEVRWDCWKHQGRPFRTGRQGCSVDKKQWQQRTDSAEDKSSDWIRNKNPSSSLFCTTQIRQGVGYNIKFRLEVKALVLLHFTWDSFGPCG